MLRSRGTRERLLILFRRRQKARIFGLQIGRPCKVFQGFLASFSCPSATSCLFFFCGFFRGFQRFEVFFEQVFHSDCIRQKRECSPNADGVRFFGRAKTNHIIAKHVYTRRFVRDRSFLEVLPSGPCEACLVSMRDNVLLLPWLHSWDGRPYFILFTNTTLHRLGSVMLTVGSNNYCQSHGVCPGVCLRQNKDKRKRESKCYRC